IESVNNISLNDVSKAGSILLQDKNAPGWGNCESGDQLLCCRSVHYPIFAEASGAMLSLLGRIGDGSQEQPAWPPHGTSSAAYALPNANLSNPVKTGLQDRLGNAFPLEGVYIMARMIGFVAQVEYAIYSPYTNNSKPVEAKCIFPLYDKAATYGFEAFINGKLLTREIKYFCSLPLICMLPFQADFETAFKEQLSNETIILTYCSNSMAASALHQAKQIALHFQMEKKSYCD
ncbi:LOW QUALITY PROTEIN: uncharacterized protein FYW23_015765, partial [Sylvia borin]